MRPLVSRRKLAVALVVAQLALLTFFLTGPAHAAGLGPTEWVIGPHRHNVLITFDGRTSPKHLHNLLTTLARKRARASFFLPGAWIAHHQMQTIALRRAGMALGNRGYRKWRFTGMDDAHIRKSILRSQKALKRAGVTPRPFFRLPKGARDLRVLRVLGAMGYRSVRWTLRPGRGTAHQVKRKVMRKVHAGSIISLDLWRPGNRRAVPLIVHALRQRGFGFRKLKVLHYIQPTNWAKLLQAGSRGRLVKALERALRHGSYPAGPVDGYFGYEDEQAVIAFEKVHQLARDAVVRPLEMEDIASDPRPTPPKRQHGRYVDVDISRQVLFEFRHHRVFRTLPVSTGGEYVYGGGAIAHTPRGHFSIIRKVAGWRNGSLGRLWYPNYFIGGFAIHGYPEVPTYPASHGCIRIPMYAAKPFFNREPLGTPVVVHN